MPDFDLKDTVPRLTKLLMDNGKASTMGEASSILEGYRLGFAIGDNEVRMAHHQTALLTGVNLAHRLTGVNLAHRTFLGRVLVHGQLNVPLKVPLPIGTTLLEAVIYLGGTPGTIPDNIPLITIGGKAQRRSSDFHVRTVCAGWRGGIFPAELNVEMPAEDAISLAAIISAALAVNEAFMFVNRQGGIIGKQPIGLSLWDPRPEIDWRDEDGGPPLTYLPDNLWLIGLGHLGQAYLWALSTLPYENPEKLSLVLQDTDIITPSTESTSILSYSYMVGERKTRSMAAWAEQCGFTTTIIERLFSSDCRRQSGEPTVALGGLDNFLARRALEEAGFELIVDAGLGHGYLDFQGIHIRTFPGSKSAQEIWNEVEEEEINISQPAYQALLNDGLSDLCGVTLLAGTSVGAPFVGATAACLVLSEVLRSLHSGSIYEFINLDLKAVAHRRARLNNAHKLKNLNTGYTNASPTKAI